MFHFVKEHVHMSLNQYKYILKDVMVPLQEYVVPESNTVSLTLSAFVIVKWLNSGYCCRPVFSSYTGHYQSLMWTPL